MPGGSDERFGSDDPTQPGEGSLLAAALRNLTFSLNEIVRDLGASTRIFDQLEAHERRHALRSIATKVTELGGIALDTGRALEALADDDGLISLT